MLKVTVELMESPAPPKTYYLSSGSVAVKYDTRETLNELGGPPRQFHTGGIKITAEGILTNRRSEMGFNDGET